MNVYFQIAVYSILPLIGIFFFGWDWREVMLLYWLENIIVGAVTLIQAARTTNTTLTVNNSKRTNTLPSGSVDVNLPPVVAKVFSCLFFTFHYGFFTLVHGVFVFVFITQGFGGVQASPAIDYTPILLLWLGVLIVQMARALLEPPTSKNIQEIFTAPYRRIIPLHLAIIFGGFAISVLNLPAAAAILLIVIHALVDIRSAMSKDTKSPATA